MAKNIRTDSPPAAATLILDDDVDGAEEGLSKGDSTFHKVRSPRFP